MSVLNMKRIQSACLSQTVRFLQKEPMDKETAEQANRTEFERYKNQMARSYTMFKIIRKQYNDHDCGSYLD